MSQKGDMEEFPSSGRYGKQKGSGEEKGIGT